MHQRVARAQQRWQSAARQARAPAGHQLLAVPLEEVVAAGGAPLVAQAGAHGGPQADADQGVAHAARVRCCARPRALL
jgi:hypothetical protein